VNDQHITAIAIIVQDVLLFASAGLIAWYLYETRKMRKAAEEQVRQSQALVSASQEQLEAQIRPAVVARRHPELMRTILVNEGKGIAVDLQLTVADIGTPTDWNSSVSFPSPMNGCPLGLGVDLGDSDTHVAAHGFFNRKALQIRYRSLSGKGYSTIVDFDENGKAVRTCFFVKDS
jgi:hypothetical protein